MPFYKNMLCLFLQEHIQEIFSTYGKIKTVDMPADRVHTHLSKGFAYVEFETPEEAQKALKHMDGGTSDCVVCPLSLKIFRGLLNYWLLWY